jgi:hypothetical protein
MAIYAKLHQLGAPEQQNLATCCVGKSDDYGADGKWRSNFEMGGGFGWGMKLSGFGARKKRRLLASGQGLGSLGGRSKWGWMKNSHVQ